MFFRKALFGIALLLGLQIGQANAATFQISFTDVGDAGPDWFGTFDAPGTGGLLTSFSALIAGTTYDFITDTFFPPAYDAANNVITDLDDFFGLGIVTNTSPIVTGTLALELLNDGTFFLASCDAGAGFTSCSSISSDPDGSYSISAVATVPLPTALPLLGAGLAGLGGLGWVKRQRDAKRAQAAS